MILNLESTTVFERNWDALHSDDIRFIVNEGGSRSSKSVSLCQLVIIYSLLNNDKVVSIVRKTFPALRATIMRDFFDNLKTLGIYDRKSHNKTENTYTFSTGTMVEFFSVDNEVKIRGRKRDICLVDEANELWQDDFIQLNMRTIDKLFFGYNPSDSNSWLYDLPENETVKIHSTYKDNPFLEDAIIKQIEALKDTDEAIYQIYALGLRTTTKLNIYSHFKAVKEKPERFTKFLYGADFGYNHPTAIVRVWYFENEVFLEKLIYESYLTTPQLIERMQQMGVDKQNEILCDTARPEIIQELNNAGYQAIKADKAVQKGIDRVKSTVVYYLESDEDIKKEYENYKWKKIGDKILDEPVKLYDDCLVADTMITTDKGDVRIIDIQLGDMVLTSNGYRKVLYKFHNGKKLVRDYSLLFDTNVVYLSSTNNHLIKTTEKWIEISKLQSGMTVFLNSSSTEKDINYIKDEDTSCNTNIICTKKCGNFIMEQGQKDTTSITSTEIAGITELKTLNLLKHQNILDFTQKIDSKIIQSGLKNFMPLVLKLQKNGISQKKESSGIDRMQLAVVLATKLMERENVKCATQTLQPRILDKNSAQINANPHLEEQVELMMLQEAVAYAHQSLHPTSIQKQQLVDVKITNERYEDTYDLMVEETHEFFANGILVHNCFDAFRYALGWIYTYYRN